MSERDLRIISPGFKAISTDLTITSREIFDLFEVEPDRRAFFERIINAWEDYVVDAGHINAEELVRIAAYDLATNEKWLTRMFTRPLTRVDNDPLSYYGDKLNAWIWAIDHLSKSDVNKPHASKLIKMATMRIKDGRINTDSGGKSNVGEIGSGPGRDYHWVGRKYIDRFTYTGVDISRAMVEVARAINPDGNFIEGDVRNLADIIKIPQAAIFAAAILHHLPYEEMDEALGQIRRTIVDNGVFFLSLRHGKGGKIDKSTGLYYHRYTYETLFPRLENHGFKIIDLSYKRLPPSTQYINVFAEAVS